MLTITVSEPNTDGVISFTMMDGVTDTALFELTNGQQLNFGAGGGQGLNIRANTQPGVVGSVYFELTGPLSNTRTENGAPYALFGDAGGNYTENALPLGNYTLTATAYNGRNQGGGALGQPYVITFSVVDQPAGNQPPVAVATASTQTGKAPLTVDFTGSGSTDDLGVVSYFWDFKDGNTSTVADPSNTFTMAGSYEVELTVTDAENESDTAMLTITVSEPGSNLPPVVVNPGTQNNNEGDDVSLQIVAVDESPNLNYQATGLPPDLSINPNTGLISGIVSSGSGGPAGSFLESNGLVIIETESVNTSGWDITNTDGETGIIANQNSFSNQNGTTIPYEITITNPGVYRFNWNSFYSGTIPTEENDNWLRFPNDSDVWFFGFRAGSAGDPGPEAEIIANLQGAQDDIVFPKGSSRITSGTTPNGNGSNGFFKVFRSGGNPEQYDWQARTSDNNSHFIYVWFVNPGTYTMEISERSLGHAIDRVALYKIDTYGYNYNTANLESAPESQRGSGGGFTPGAAENSPYNVSITVTDEGSPQESTTESFTWIIGSDSGSGNNGSQSVSSFTLINADNDSDLFEITQGMQIDEALIQNIGLNIRANTNPSLVGSVALSISGPINNNRTENGAPYAFFGDSGGNYAPVNFPSGNYTITATPYENPSLGGEAGTTLSVSFTITSGSGLNRPLPEGNFVPEITPNPTAEKVQVTASGSVPEIEKVLLFDMSGRLVKSIELKSNGTGFTPFSFDVIGVEDGLYIIQMWSKDSQQVSEHRLLIKQ